MYLKLHRHTKLHSRKNKDPTHLGQVIVFSLEDLLEAGDGLVDGHQLAGVVGEHLSDL